MAEIVLKHIESGESKRTRERKEKVGIPNILTNNTRAPGATQGRLSEFPQT